MGASRACDGIRPIVATGRIADHRSGDDRCAGFRRSSSADLGDESPDARIAAGEYAVATRSCQIAMALRPCENPTSIISRQGGPEGAPQAPAVGLRCGSGSRSAAGWLSNCPAEPAASAPVHPAAAVSLGERRFHARSRPGPGRPGVHLSRPGATTCRFFPKKSPGELKRSQGELENENGSK
jgi:hypothetical protein